MRHIHCCCLCACVCVRACVHSATLFAFLHPGLHECARCCCAVSRSICQMFEVFPWRMPTHFCMSHPTRHTRTVHTRGQTDGPRTLIGTFRVHTGLIRSLPDLFSRHCHYHSSFPQFHIHSTFVCLFVCRVCLWVGLHLEQAGNRPRSHPVVDSCK